MKAPKIDLRELKRMKEENFRERLEFIDFYAERLKSQSEDGKPAGKNRAGSSLNAKSR